MSKAITVELTEPIEKVHSMRYDIPKDQRNKAAVSSIYISKAQLALAFGDYPDGVKITIEPIS